MNSFAACGYNHSDIPYVLCTLTRPKVYQMRYLKCIPRFTRFQSVLRFLNVSRFPRFLNVLRFPFISRFHNILRFPGDSRFPCISNFPDFPVFPIPDFQVFPNFFYKILYRILTLFILDFFTRFRYQISLLDFCHCQMRTYQKKSKIFTVLS